MEKKLHSRTIIAPPESEPYVTAMKTEAIGLMGRPSILLALSLSINDQVNSIRGKCQDRTLQLLFYATIRKQKLY